MAKTRNLACATTKSDEDRRQVVLDKLTPPLSRGYDELVVLLSQPEGACWSLDLSEVAVQPERRRHYPIQTPCINFTKDEVSPTSLGQLVTVNDARLTNCL
ncbi:hypothetical protein AZE42_02504 [Rhizopogon vesiculosus]|uniref:Uncharacterized protein n=1 Tax=Rhizopogon vesiculosus TaxID=180088 RepID=A0A1J8QLT1_9AGAM|nr:hypothetical protein AZE42_02504 [Rhizopogon vesiculosus]